jgi:hypothetical protein
MTCYTNGMRANEMHARETRTRDMHARDMHAYETPAPSDARSGGAACDTPHS